MKRIFINAVSVGFAMEVVIIRFGEIGTKGKNRMDFIRNLTKNIRKTFLKNTGQKADLVYDRARLYLKTDLAKEIVCENLQKIFGIASYSFAYVVSLDLDLIKKKIGEILGTDKNIKNKKMRVSVNRIEKNLCESPKLQADIGSYVEKKLGILADYKNFDIEISIEIRDKAYIFFEKIEGPGGIPSGIEGRIVCVIDSQKSFYAGYGMLKRGCEIFPVFFIDAEDCGKNRSEFNEQSAEIIVEMLGKYSPNKLTLNKISFQNLNEFALQHDCCAIAVSDALASVRNYGFPALRPCIV